MKGTPGTITIMAVAGLALFISLLIFSRVSFIMGTAYYEGGVFTMAPLTDGQRVGAAKAKIRRALHDPRTAEFGEITVSRAAGSHAICGTVTSKNGGPQTPQRFVVIDGDVFFHDEALTHNMWILACRLSSPTETRLSPRHAAEALRLWLP